jgi:hypothetical protein
LLDANYVLTVLVTALKKIVNEAWGLDSLDSTKLAKYMRCLFQVALSDSPDTAEQLLSQICSLAQEAAEVDSHNLLTHPSIGITDSIK